MAEALDKAGTTGQREPLGAEDVHLLALVEHKLADYENADKHYEQAEDLYRTQLETSHDTRYRIAAALCAADHGELLLEGISKPLDAAHRFREADAGLLSLGNDSDEDKEDFTAQRDAGAVFRMTVLCREASAYLKVNRWNDANLRLDAAVGLTENFGTESYFAAQVHRNRAWAQIIQWKMLEAKSSFMKSNEILEGVIRRDLAELEGNTDFQDTTPSDRSEMPQPSLSRGKDLPNNPFERLIHFEDFHRSSDFASKLAFLHNLHGIAMVQRFRGDTLGASRDYRLLARHVESTFSDLTQGTMKVKRRMSDRRSLPTETLHRLYVVRSINTQERLGDCNLFGNPKLIDHKEAIDDYRRARSLVHLLVGVKRDQSMAALLYKTALALAMPSPVQDTDLAMEICEKADATFAEHEEEKIATGLYWTLGKLTTAIVKVLNQNECVSVEGEEPCPKLSESLRTAILDCRDELGQHPHRDQLEILLFASKVLLEQSPVKSRFQRGEDADLLLSFCRLALGAYRFETSSQKTESQAYLRPYYDSVMRAKLEMPTRHHVLDLLEIQAEATTGVRYMKMERLKTDSGHLSLRNRILPLDGFASWCQQGVSARNHLR